ncbi:hypothetical protein [Phosphitispora fastidiosa]|uniref:hypothetical protein n=1 Tax=Phosphitispora fastidiosa TaxID=2837202 RepID=UPI001E32F2D0|nr:hypothetical protein [Phosphitispora fastidiosa]MBU7008213.1 hypothetical protein [Phosphitispora fastidiosa]
MVDQRILNSDILVISDQKDEQQFLDYIDGGIDNRGKQKLIELFRLMPKPITVVVENYYVDKVFRDSYYNYFSSKHFDTFRNCKRISFFEGDNIDFEDFILVEGHSKLQQNFIGYTVIKPISPGSIGRTMVDPKRLAIPKCFVRTTTFSAVILGAKLYLDSFPFSSQDTETMTCAETTVWSILEYFGTRYPDYKIIYPSNIIEVLGKQSYERILPSKGLSYSQISALIKDFGFSPRIYVDNAFPVNDFKRIFHYYIESGLPIAVVIKGFENGREIRHAVVCIGHSNQTKNVSSIKINDLDIINSADLYDDYVIMDDNQIPFKVQNYSNLSVFNNTNVEGIIVPLYKRIFLEAGDASTIIYNTLLNSGYGIKKSLQSYDNGGENYSENNPLVVRIFLTSSRSYKNFRAINCSEQELAKVYSHLPLPKFIWVAEISLNSLFKQGQIFGEIIIDATASRYSHANSLVAIHYPGYLGYRLPDEPLNKIFDMMAFYSKEFSNTYPMYNMNLIIGGQ